MRKKQYVFHPGREVGNFTDMLQGLIKSAEKPIRVTIEEHSPPKTRQQEKYFFGVVLREIVRQMREVNGVHVQEWAMREMLKQEFLPRVPSLIDPSKWYPKSQAALTKQEYIDFIEECIAWASNLGFYIPSPNEGPLDET